jgi:uncharacterized DUF497 family protein
MNISGIVWLDAIVDKLAQKHGVDIDEVEEVFSVAPRFRFVAKGNRADEDVYMATGQTASGRYLSVLFIRKVNGKALVLSARDMAGWERKRHERK